MSFWGPGSRFLRARNGKRAYGRDQMRRSCIFYRENNRGWAFHVFSQPPQKTPYVFFAYEGNFLSLALHKSCIRLSRSIFGCVFSLLFLGLTLKRPFLVGVGLPHPETSPYHCSRSNRILLSHEMARRDLTFKIKYPKGQAISRGAPF